MTQLQVRLPVVASASPTLVSRVIEADAADLYALVADVTNMGRWSPECERCEWLDGASAAVVGARFRGHNHVGRFRWSTVARIDVAEPGRELTFTVLQHGREETRWRYRFDRSGSATTVTESYEIIWLPWYSRIQHIVLRRDKRLRAAMGETLGRISAAAERPS